MCGPAVLVSRPAPLLLGARAVPKALAIESGTAFATQHGSVSWQLVTDVTQTTCHAACSKGTSLLVAV